MLIAVAKDKRAAKTLYGTTFSLRFETSPFDGCTFCRTHWCICNSSFLEQCHVARYAPICSKAEGAGE